MHRQLAIGQSFCHFNDFKLWLLRMLRLAMTIAYESFVDFNIDFHTKFFQASVVNILQKSFNNHLSDRLAITSKAVPKKYFILNRYRRRLETCPQAKTSKSGRYFLRFFRRVRATSMTQRGVENTRVHFWTFLPLSVKTHAVGRDS